MGVLGRLGCGCRHRPFGDLAKGAFDAPGDCATDLAAGADGRSPALQQYLLRDPLMGAQSEADVDLAAELKQQGNDKYKKELFQDALGLYNEAVQLQPRNPSLWLNRSMANRQLKNWEDGAEDAELAAELQPDNAKAHYSQALCLQQLGQLDLSLKSCRAGLNIQQDNKALQQLLNVVKRSLDDPSRDGRLAAEPAPSASGSGGDSGDAAKRSEKIRKGEVRRRKRILTQKEKDRRMEAAKSSNVDSSACPASVLKENELHDIKQRASKAMFQWKNPEPSQAEREGLKQMMTDMFKGKYVDINAQKESLASGKKKTGLQTDQYDKEQKQGLKLKGGHQPMERPEHVDLPKGFKDSVGILTLDELKKYSFENEDRRYFISVYGNIFDVSDRPDKYGPDGPYTILTGADITWGLAAGVDSEEYVNRCFDLFKAKDLGKDKIAGVCSWLAWYWVEYGDPVGHLDLYLRESELPAPPLEEIDEACCVM